MKVALRHLPSGRCLSFSIIPIMGMGTGAQHRFGDGWVFVSADGREGGRCVLNVKDVTQEFGRGYVPPRDITSEFEVIEGEGVRLSRSL